MTKLRMKKHTLVNINLKSLLIGNGLTDPLTQYKYYPKMACENQFGPVLNTTTCQKMKDTISACQRLIQNCYTFQNASACLPATLKCNSDQIMPYMQAGYNPYDVRMKCKGENGEQCYEIRDSIHKYLKLPKVKKEIGAEVRKYKSCNEQVGIAFESTGDWMLPYVNKLPILLEDGVRILIYAGDADYICNWLGNKAWTLELPWTGQEEFAAANDTVWYSELKGEQGGELRKTKDNRFAFLRIFGAGHLVPYDQPEVSLDMMQAWIRNELN